MQQLVRVPTIEDPDRTSPAPIAAACQSLARAVQRKDTAIYIWQIQGISLGVAIANAVQTTTVYTGVVSSQDIDEY